MPSAVAAAAALARMRSRMAANRTCAGVGKEEEGIGGGGVPFVLFPPPRTLDETAWNGWVAKQFEPDPHLPPAVSSVASLVVLLTGGGLGFVLVGEAARLGSGLGFGTNPLGGTIRRGGMGTRGMARRSVDEPGLCPCSCG